jgi:hypothetical protein
LRAVAKAGGGPGRRAKQIGKGRAVAGAALHVQQPQFLQVQGLQRQPPLRQAQAGFASIASVMVILLLLAMGRLSS